MLIYIFIFLVLLFIKKKYHSSLSFSILILFTILRYDVGWDYRWYYHLAKRHEFLEIPFFPKNILNYINKFDWEVWEYYRLELLNKIIYKTNWFFKLSPQFVIVLYGVITLIFIKKGIEKNIKKRYRSKNIYLTFYALPLFYLNTLNYMRQGVAVSLIFYSYTFIKRKKLFKFILLVVIATLFHKTAIITLIIYFLSDIKISRKIYLIILIIGLFFDEIFKTVTLRYNIPLIVDYRGYIKNSFGAGGRKLFYVILLIGLVILILSFIDKKFYQKNNFLISIVLIGVFIYCSLISLGHLGPRMSMYFLIFILYLVPEIERSLLKFKIKKYIFSIFLLIILILQLYSDKNNIVRSQYVPYKIIFLNSKKY